MSRVDEAGASEMEEMADGERVSQGTSGAGSRGSTGLAGTRDLTVIHIAVEGVRRLVPSAVIRSPAVRMHIVDKATGQYLPRRGAEVADGRVTLEQQQHFLTQPGFPTMISVFTPEGAAVETLASVPAGQSKDCELREHLCVTGELRLRDDLIFDHDFQTTLVPTTLILFELLQQPVSAKHWRSHRRCFHAGVHRIAWAFLDCGSAQVHAACCAARQPGGHDGGVPLQLRLHRWSSNLMGGKTDFAGGHPAEAVFQQYGKLYMRGQGGPDEGAAEATLRQRASSSVAGALAPGVEPPGVLCVRLRAAWRPVADDASMETTLKLNSSGARETLPIGFGSGWDNFRGEPGAPPTIQLTQHLGAALTSREELLQMLRRDGAEPCLMPHAWHPALAATGEGALAGSAAPLRHGRCSCIAFGAEGLLLAVAAEEGTHTWAVRVLDVVTSQSTGLCMRGQGGVVNALAWVPAASATLVAGSTDGTVRTWYLEAPLEQRLSGNPSATLAGRRSTMVPSVAWSVDHSSVLHTAAPVLCCSFCPRRVRLAGAWGSAAAEAATAVSGGATSTRGSAAVQAWFLASASEGAVPTLWAVTARAGTPVKMASSPHTPAAQVMSMEWLELQPQEPRGGGAPSGAEAAHGDSALRSLRQFGLLTGHGDGMVVEWVLRSCGHGIRLERRRVAQLDAPVRCIRWSAHAGLLAFTDASRVSVLSAATFKTTATLPGLGSGRHVLQACVDPAAGRWLLAGTDDGHACFWDLLALRKGKCPQAQRVRLWPPTATSGGAGWRRGEDVHAVAWSSRLHVVAAISRHPAGGLGLLCAARAGAHAAAPAAKSTCEA